MNKLIHLGYCKKVHGIKGGFCFVLFNLEDSVLLYSHSIFIKAINSSIVYNDIVDLDNSFFPYIISKISIGNKVIVYLDDIDSRNKAEELVPFDIFIDRSSMPILNSDEFYLSDLIGINVVNFENNEIVGKVTNVGGSSIQYYLEIDDGKNGISIPYVDLYIKNLNIEKQILTIVVPEYI